MSIEHCVRCERRVDLDLHSENIVYIDDGAVCLACLTPAELDKWERCEI